KSAVSRAPGNTFAELGAGRARRGAGMARSTVASSAKVRFLEPQATPSQSSAQGGRDAARGPSGHGAGRARRGAGATRGGRGAGRARHNAELGPERGDAPGG